MKKTKSNMSVLAVILIFVLNSTCPCNCESPSVQELSLSQSPEELDYNVVNELSDSTQRSLTEFDTHLGSRNELNELEEDQDGDTYQPTEIVPQITKPPLRDSLYIVIPMTCIYSLILITGLLGNISTCIVIAKNNYMHTATNYYLFSLAISDLLLLISGLPQEMYLIWFRYPYIFSEPFCIIRGLAAETSANATVLTITAFTVERYVAICHPLRSHKLSQLSRVIRAVISIWIIALTLAVPQAAQFGIIDEEAGGVVTIKGAWCTIKRVLIPYAFQISICVFFIVPMSIITALYILIGLKLWRTRRGPSHNSQELTVEPHRFSSTSRHSQTHVIRMLVSVVVAFGVCWGSFHAQRLLAIYAHGTKSEMLVKIYDFINHVSGILYFVSTCINPILYHIMSNKFRQAFKDTLRRLVIRRRPNGIHHHRTYSGASYRSSRMGLVLQTNLLQGGGSAREHRGLGRQGTCLNCRHTPSMCSCRGNNSKFIRTYATPTPNPDPVDSDINNSASPNLRDKDLALTTDRAGNGNTNNRQGPANSSQMRTRTNPGYMAQSHSQQISLKKVLQASAPQNQHSFLGLLRSKKQRSSAIPCSIEERNAILSNITSRYQRETESSESGPTSGIYTQKFGTSRSSISSSRSNNTISNSSLQDLDKNEYTGEELAGYLAEMRFS